MTLLPAWVVLAVTIPVAMLLGRLVVTHRMLALLPAAALVAMLLLTSPHARVLFIVFGGLLIFQSSEQLDFKKLLFLMGATVAFAGAFMRSRKLSSTAAYADMSPLFYVSFAFVALLLVSLPVAQYYGTPDKAWLRDIAPYMLFACAPLFAFDAQSAMSTRALRRLVATAGIAGGAAFALRWIAKRGIANLPWATIGLPTFLLGAALFAFGMAVVLEGRRGWSRWLVLTSLLLAMLISTGTRSAAVLLVAPLAIVIGTRERFSRRAIRLAVAIPIAALLAVFGTQSLLKLVHANRGTLASRAALVFHTGGSSDRSYLDRVSQTKAAWTLFTDQPLLGAGPGHVIEWRDSFGRLKADPNVDSPAAYPAKFGLAGLIPLAVLVGAFVSFLRRLRQRAGGRTTAQLALIGYAAVVAAWFVLGVPFGDKGLSSGFLLLVALAVSEAASAKATETAAPR